MVSIAASCLLLSKLHVTTPGLDTTLAVVHASMQNAMLNLPVRPWKGTGMHLMIVVCLSLWNSLQAAR